MKGIASCKPAFAQVSTASEVLELLLDGDAQYHDTEFSAIKMETGYIKMDETPTALSRCQALRSQHHSEDNQLKAKSLLFLLQDPAVWDRTAGHPTGPFVPGARADRYETRDRWLQERPLLPGTASASPTTEPMVTKGPFPLGPRDRSDPKQKGLHPAGHPLPAQGPHEHPEPGTRTSALGAASPPGPALPPPFPGGAELPPPSPSRKFTQCKIH